MLKLTPKSATGEFRVSVIIPVYNAARYLRNAVESAVALDEVGEVVLVEDSSPDDSYKICQSLQAASEKVALYTHTGRVNKGIAPTRNLGIIKSTCEYVAFLDADDWYLSNRFARASEIFENDASVDGVYDATAHFYEESQFLDDNLLTTLKREVKPSDLLYTLLQTHSGRFHTNAITLRRSIFRRSGLFDESLKLHEDTHLWLRLAFVGKLVPGQLREPVAVRRVHSENSIRLKDSASRGRLYERCFEWFRNEQGVDPRAYRIMLNRYIASQSSGVLSRTWSLCRYFLERPRDFRNLF